MTQRSAMRLTATVLDAPDPRALARFYQRLLGWALGSDEPGWVTLRPPGGGAGLSFQAEGAHVRPAWPAGPGDQQMQMHLDIEADDLEAAGAQAVVFPLVPPAIVGFGAAPPILSAATVALGTVPAPVAPSFGHAGPAPSPVAPAVLPVGPVMPVPVPAVAVGTGRPTARLVMARRTGPVRAGRRERPLVPVRVRLVVGPVSPVSVRAVRLGPGRPGVGRPDGLGSGRRGRWGGGRRGDRDRFLPRRTAQDGHDRAGTVTARRPGTAVRRRTSLPRPRRTALGPAARGRLGRGGPGTAGGLHPALAWRLDLDDAGPAQVGRDRVEPAGRRPVERLGQELAGRHHRRQRGRRQRRHPQGDNHRCVAARRHARRSPAS